MIDLTGRLLDIKRDYRSKKPVATFELEEQDVDNLAGLGTDTLVIKVARKKDVRSLDSNSYFHLLNRKLANKLVISEARCKNHLLSSYGFKEFLDEEERQPLVYKTNAPEDYMIEREEVHTKLAKIEPDGETITYFYWIYRGSHTYNSEEMAHLLEGTIAECKEQGIETATPDELARMAALWENRRK